MTPAPLHNRFVRAERPVVVTLHQPGDRGTVTTHTGRLLGGMYARGELHHLRLLLEDGVVLMAPPTWVARDSRCRVLQAGMEVPDHWDDGSLFVPLIRDAAAAWSVDIGAIPGEPETVA